MKTISKFFLYLLSFLEGATVMVAELLGAKMLAPYFGASLYVWSSVLAITLGGLALGYFTGGILSHKKKSPDTLFYIMLIAAVFTILMPFLSKGVMSIASHFSLLPALLISTITFLLPPVFLMGMISPLIIGLLVNDISTSGRIAGSVYAVSTVGGIIATFITGFYIIPNYGLTIPCICAGILLGILPFFMLIVQRKLVVLLFPVLSFFAAKQARVIVVESGIKVQYTSEGLLGQVMVADLPVYDSSGIVKDYLRYLYFNRIAQSVISVSDPAQSGFPYSKLIADQLSSLQSGKDILVLGLGGGNLSNKLIEKGYHVDACELDDRVVEVAKRFFFLSPQINCSVDDARHYIRNASKKYDVIIFDVFKGEENPNHVFTKESIEETMHLLNDKGLIIVNGNGYWQNEEGRGMRSIYKTLVNQGFHVTVIPTTIKPEERNLVFIASRDGEIENVKDALLVASNDMNGVFVLEDEKPVLDILNLQANKAWREGYIKYSTIPFSRSKVPLFN